MPNGKATATEMAKPEKTRLKLASRCLASIPFRTSCAILANTTDGAGKRKWFHPGRELPQCHKISRMINPDAESARLFHTNMILRMPLFIRRNPFHATFICRVKHY
jgi:hypothetical protein